MTHKPKSLWWALQCVFWYRWDHGVPLFTRYIVSAWWHGFYLRTVYNTDASLLDEEDTPREAVANDVSYWEE